MHHRKEAKLNLAHQKSWGDNTKMPCLQDGGGNWISITYRTSEFTICRVYWKRRLEELMPRYRMLNNLTSSHAQLKMLATFSISYRIWSLHEIWIAHRRKISNLFPTNKNWSNSQPKLCMYFFFTLWDDLGLDGLTLVAKTSIFQSKISTSCWTLLKSQTWWW